MGLFHLVEQQNRVQAVVRIVHLLDERWLGFRTLFSRCRLPHVPVRPVDAPLRQERLDIGADVARWRAEQFGDFSREHHDILRAIGLQRARGRIVA